MILMNLEKSTEEKLIQVIKEIFVDDDWDFRHTLSAVSAMKKIVASEGGDEKVLVTVMYLHDIGYAGALKNGYTLSDRIEAKSKHLERGSELAKKILSNLDFTSEEVSKIVYLISVHDKLDDLKSRDELFVLEADSLAQIDPTVGNSFGEEEFAKYVSIFDRRRAPKFITLTGKKLLKEFATKNKLFAKYSKFFR